MPGLLTLSSSKVLIASRLLSDLPLPDSPLKPRDETDQIFKKQENKPQKDTLVLGGASHVIVGIVGKLEDVGREKSFLVGGITILCRVFEENGIRVAGNVFMGVYSDQGGRVYSSVDVVSEKTLSEAGDHDVVRDVWKGGEVGDILELLVVGGSPSVGRHCRDCRLPAGSQLSRRGSWLWYVGEAVNGGMARA